MSFKQLVIYGLTVIVMALSTAKNACADEFDDLFSDDPFADIEVETQPTETSAFSISHTFESKANVNYASDKDDAVEERFSGLTGLTFSYQPAFDYQPNDVYSFGGEFKFTTDTIFQLRDEDWGDDLEDERQFQFDINELIAQVRFEQWQFSTGVQRVALGMADVLSVSNRLYAQNLSQPGTVDIDDSWLPAWTTVAYGSLGNIRVKAGSVHAHQINAIPVTGSDMDTGMDVMLESAGLDYEAEDVAFDKMGWFVSFSGVAGPLDWQVNGISQLSHSPVVEMGMITTPSVAVVPNDVVYPRENTVALAVSYLYGPILWKAEAAFIEGLQAQTMAGSSLGSMTDYQQLVGSFGLDYDPADFGRLVAEVQVARIFDYDDLDLVEGTAPDETTAQWAMTYSQDFLREQLEISAQIIAFDIDASGGRMQGISATYDWDDHWQTGIKLVDFVSGDYILLDGADDRDRLILTARYQF